MLLKGRRQVWITLLIFSMALFANGECVAYEILKRPHYQIWGYYPYWLKDDWKKIDLKLYDQVLFFEVPIGTEGKLLPDREWPGNWKKLIAAAKKKGVRLQPTFTLFDEKIFESIFSDQLQRKMLQAGMLALLEQANSSGMQLDFEIFNPVSSASIDGFRLFLKSLKQKLARKKTAMSLFLLAGNKAGLYDRRSLQYPDHVVIQGYDAHWKESPIAGPIVQLLGNTPVSWESSLKYYLSLGVPRRKILMSVPYFGYEWPTVNDSIGAQTRGEGSEISYAPLPANVVPAVKSSAIERTRQYGALRDPATGAPYYSYNDGTGWFQGWFEDEASFLPLFEFIKHQHLAGIAVFPLGYDDGMFQQLLRRHFR